MTHYSALARRRFALRMPVELLGEELGKIGGLLIELSQDCARVSQLPMGELQSGALVTLETPCGMRRPARVRCASNGTASLRFENALHLPELGALIEANRASSPEAELHYGT